MSLTDIAIRNAKPREKAYKLGDGRGLYLLLEPNGSKLWRLKYRFADKDRKLSLGAYPEVPLGLARVAFGNLITKPRDYCRDYRDFVQRSPPCHRTICKAILQ